VFRRCLRARRGASGRLSSPEVVRTAPCCRRRHHRWCCRLTAEQAAARCCCLTVARAAAACSSCSRRAATSGTISAGGRPSRSQIAPRRTATRQCRVPSGSALGGARRTHLLSNLCIQLIILPRQARDKHIGRQAPKKRYMFFSWAPGWCKTEAFQLRPCANERTNHLQQRRPFV